MLALQNQIHEAEHALMDSNPIKFYDCLVPTLKEHRRAKKVPQTLDELRQELILKSKIKAMESQQKQKDDEVIQMLRERNN